MKSLDLRELTISGMLMLISVGEIDKLLSHYMHLNNCWPKCITTATHQQYVEKKFQIFDTQVIGYRSVPPDTYGDPKSYMATKSTS